MSEYWHGLKPVVEFKLADWPWKEVMAMNIEIPDGMLKAAEANVSSDPSSNGLYLAIEGALRWLSPEIEKLKQKSKYEGDYMRSESMYEYDRRAGYNQALSDVCRMFLAPELEILEFRECESCRAKPGSPLLCFGCRHNRAVIEKLTGKTTGGRR